MAQVKKILDPTPKPIGSPNHSHYSGEDWGFSYKGTVGKVLGNVNNLYGKMFDNKILSQVFQGHANYIWRALLFTNRAHITHRIKKVSKYDLESNSKFTDGVVSTGILNTEKSVEERGKAFHEQVLQLNQIAFPNRSTSRQRVAMGHDLQKILQESGYGSYEDLLGVSTEYTKSNQVILYNILAIDNEENRTERMYIELQVRPPEIEIKPESKWATIESMGRNLPMYHYTGGEETLEFNISWYMKGKPDDPDFNPYWVINQCQKLKAWSMASGYMSSPPVIAIYWGRANIFKDARWILTKAEYTLSSFKDITIFKNYPSGVSGALDPNIPDKSTIVDSGLVPFSATQSLAFKRVASYNLFYKDIANYQKRKSSATKNPIGYAVGLTNQILASMV